MGKAMFLGMEPNGMVANIDGKVFTGKFMPRATQNAHLKTSIKLCAKRLQWSHCRFPSAHFSRCDAEVLVIGENKAMWAVLKPAPKLTERQPFGNRDRPFYSSFIKSRGCSNWILPVSQGLCVTFSILKLVLPIFLKWSVNLKILLLL